MAAQSGGGGEDYWKCPYSECTGVLPVSCASMTQTGMTFCPFCKQDLRRAKVVSEPQLSDSPSREAAGQKEDGSDASDSNKLRGATSKTGAAPDTHAGSSASTLETTVAPKADPKGTPATSDKEKNDDSQPESSDTVASDSRTATSTEGKADSQNETTIETPPTASGVATSEADQPQTDPESPAGDTGETAPVTPSDKKSAQIQTPAASETSASGSEAPTTSTPEARGSRKGKPQSHTTQTPASGSGGEREVDQSQITTASAGSSGDGTVHQLQTAATKASAATIGKTPPSVAPPSQQASPASTGSQGTPGVKQPTVEIDPKKLPLQSSSGKSQIPPLSEESMASAKGSSSTQQLGSAVLSHESSGKSDEYKTPVQETGNGDSEKDDEFFDTTEAPNGNVTIENDPAKEKSKVPHMMTRAQLKEEGRKRREEERKIEREERKEAKEKKEQERRDIHQKEQQKREQLKNQPKQQSHLKTVPAADDPLQGQKTGTEEPPASGTGDGSGSSVDADGVSIQANLSHI